jgi:hypothetical protein
MQDDPQPSIKPFVFGIHYQHPRQPLFNFGIVDNSGDRRLVEILVALELAISLSMPKTAIKEPKSFSHGELESSSSTRISGR